jgi:hypothetical protein
MPDEPAAGASGKPAKGEKPVGKVEHYYPKAKAAAVGLTGDLKVGDDIHIVGHGDDVRTKVKSLQLDHAPVEAGHAGQHIGVGLAKKVHEGDDVLVVSAKPQAAKPRAAKKAAGRPRAPKRAKKAAKKARKARAPKRAKKASKGGKAKRAKAGRRAAPKARGGKAKGKARRR